MRELPFTVNVTQELEKIEIEDMRSALLGGITAMAQAIPAMATQGQDPSEMVNKIAAVIKARQKGQALEDAIEATFTPQQQVPPAGAAPTVEQPSPAPTASPAGGASPEQGVQLPQQQAAPQDITSLISSLSGQGRANASIRTVNRV
jgi:hypothetical protein